MLHVKVAEEYCKMETKEDKERFNLVNFGERKIKMQQAVSLSFVAVFVLQRIQFYRGYNFDTENINNKQYFWNQLELLSKNFWVLKN